MTPKETKKLEKFLLYVLSRRPDEFGLLPDAQGYVKLKTLFQALHEEAGWKNIRQANINAVMLMRKPPAIEIDSNGIRACQRDHMPPVELPDKLPKLLYTSIRRRAHRSIHTKGLYPGALPHILLSPDPAMARRLGLRMDNEPVQLTVQTASAIDAGTSFRKFGENLYLADFLSPDTFSGPPLPKEQSDTRAPQPKEAPQRSETPGSYFPDLGEMENKPKHHRSDTNWKKNRRLARREKERQRR